MKYMEFDSKLLAKKSEKSSIGDVSSDLQLTQESPVWIIPTKDLSFGTMIDRLLVYAPVISADPTQQESLKELRQGRSMGC